MKTRSFSAAVLVFCVLGGGYAWMLRRSASPLAQSAPYLESPVVGNVEEVSPAMPLPIVEPTAPAQVEMSSVDASAASVRVAPESPPSQDFESKYKLKTSEEMRAAQSLLQQQLGVASQARFDELFLEFPSLLANGKYGARIVPAGQPVVNRGGVGVHSQNRGVKNATGASDWHCLEFNSSDEPATAGLFAEYDWLRQRLELVAKKD